MAYYKSLDCKPVFDKAGDCCAYRYDCDEVKSLPANKCYANNGQAYNIGDKLKEEDANPCDIGCVCERDFHGVWVWKL